MKAAVFREVDHPLEVEEVEIDSVRGPTRSSFARVLPGCVTAIYITSRASTPLRLPQYLDTRLLGLSKRWGSRCDT